MENNLPTTFENMSKAEVMKAIGQDTDSYGIGVPVLRVNYHEEDAAENPLTKGLWTFTTEDGVQIFSKEVTVRFFMRTYQYSHYDSDTEKMVAVSSHFNAFKDEAPDTAGGNKCGKVTRKEFEELNEAEQKTQKAIKLSQVCFGLLTMEGKDALGNDRSVENTPCVFYAKGSHYMPIADYLQSLSKQRKLYFDVVTTMGVKKHKNGTLNYWSAVPEITGECEFTPADMQLMHDFRDVVKTETESILDQHDAAVAKQQKARGYTKASDTIIQQTMPQEAMKTVNGMDEEIPF